MSDTLNTFPANNFEALALLYVKSQNLSGFSPEQLYDLYLEAENRIRAQYKLRREERFTQA